MVWCWPGDKPLSEPMWSAYWFTYASLGLNESTARFFLLCDLSGLILWAVESNTSLCRFHTSSLIIFFTSHHVAILLALCSQMVTLIFQSLHVCAFCVNNSFPKFVTREILWVIDEVTNIVTNICHQSNILLTANMFKNPINHHGWPEKHLSHLWEKDSKPFIFHTLQLLPSKCTQELYLALRWWIYCCSDRSTLVLQNM